MRVIARSADTTGELAQEGVEFVAGSIADKRSIYKVPWIHSIIFYKYIYIYFTNSKKRKLSDPAN